MIAVAITSTLALLGLALAYKEDSHDERDVRRPLCLCG